MPEPFLENEPQRASGQRRGLWLLALFTAVMLPILLGLGFWQLDRARQREAMLSDWQQRVADEPIPGERLGPYRPDWLHRRVALTGEYQPRYQWLLDNRTHQGRVGYEVISAFRREPDGAWILVNRGWIAAPPRREQLPELPLPEGRQRLEGGLAELGSRGLVLRDTPAEPGWPRRVQALIPEHLEADLGLSLLPWLVRLGPDQPGALAPMPGMPAMTPERHRGYAAQWFGLAAVLATGFVLVLIRTSRETS